MELILWRHADAEDGGPAGDAARELTGRGRRQAERMAHWLRPRLEGEWRILSSPARRAIGTVEALGLDYEVCEGLSTATSASGLLAAVGWPNEGRVLAVGHQPTLGEVAARLLDGEAGEVTVRKGAILWFATRERDGGTHTVLRAVLDPDLLEQGSRQAQ
jgi:phosphohistidine phosphatase